MNCWSAEDARKFLEVARQQDSQTAAFFAPVIEVAKVKRITVHGLRHTSATLQLLAKGAVHLATDRNGEVIQHQSVGNTAHQLPI